MNRIISPFQFREELNKKKTLFIDENFVLVDKFMDNAFYSSTFLHPFKLDMYAIIICINGEMNGNVDLREYNTLAPSLFIVLPEQILQYKDISANFSGHIILLSKKFAHDLLLNIQESALVLLAIRRNPTISLAPEQLVKLINYFSQLKDIVLLEKNPYRSEIVKNLLRAYFYEFGFHYHQEDIERANSSQNRIAKTFFELLEINYKQYHTIDFYADKLCITPKHLAKVVKENTGITPTKWIDDYRILESKALLKSTNMTIQQISEILYFDSQSYFGKYFKRHTGISPSEYRKT